MEFKFTPLKEFIWDRKYEDGVVVRIGHYHVGNTYNCSRHPRHDALREICKEWEKDGKIKKFPLPPGSRMKTVNVGA